MCISKDTLAYISRSHNEETEYHNFGAISLIALLKKAKGELIVCNSTPESQAHVTPTETLKVRTDDAPLTASMMLENRFNASPPLQHYTSQLPPMRD
jgi:hypothetical protein